MDTSQPIIEIKGLSYKYAAAEKWALRDINLKIHEGEYVALVGLNGAGKTTLGLCLNGIIPNMIMGEMEGEVLIKGLDTFEHPVRELAKIVGMVFDNPDYQMSQFSVAEEIALGLENLGLPYEQMKGTITEVLETVGLSGFEERSPYALSGGQQQRLMIAASLAMRPTILVMDEPTSNIDPIGKEEVFAVASTLNKRNKMTVIIAEHEVDMIASFADRIIVMHDGRVVLNGSPREVFREIEAFQKYGLRVPQVTELFHKLSSRASRISMDELPTTLDQAEILYAALLGS